MTGYLPALRVECAECGSPEGESCRSRDGGWRTPHVARREWYRSQRRFAQFFVTVLVTSPERGLVAGDEVLVVGFPPDRDSQVLVIRRSSDWFEPWCSMSADDVAFVEWATPDECVVVSDLLLRGW